MGCNRIQEGLEYFSTTLVMLSVKAYRESVLPNPPRFILQFIESSVHHAGGGSDLALGRDDSCQEL